MTTAANPSPANSTPSTLAKTSPSLQVQRLRYALVGAVLLFVFITQLFAAASSTGNRTLHLTLTAIGTAVVVAGIVMGFVKTRR